MQPSVGRVVHYVSFGSPGGEYPSVCRAATITEVGGLVDGQRYPGVEHSSDDEVVSLAVLSPEGMFFARGVLHGAEIEELERREQVPGPKLTHAPGTWHWPERV